MRKRRAEWNERASVQSRRTKISAVLDTWIKINHMIRAEEQLRRFSSLYLSLSISLRLSLRHATSPRACSYVGQPKLRGMRDAWARARANRLFSPSVSSSHICRLRRRRFSPLSREGKTARSLDRGYFSRGVTMAWCRDRRMSRQR